jgi:hypothetical protein
MARTRQQERMRYQGLSPRAFGEAVGLSEGSVREMIEVGWFRWTADVAGQKKTPECMDVRKPGGQRAEYRIKASAVDRYHRERAVCGEQAA